MYFYSSDYRIMYLNKPFRRHSNEASKKKRKKRNFSSHCQAQSRDFSSIYFFLSLLVVHDLQLKKYCWCNASNFRFFLLATTRKKKLVISLSGSSFTGADNTCVWMYVFNFYFAVAAPLFSNSTMNCWNSSLHCIKIAFLSDEKRVSK